MVVCRGLPCHAMPCQCRYVLAHGISQVVMVAFLSLVSSSFGFARGKGEVGDGDGDGYTRGTIFFLLYVLMFVYLSINQTLMVWKAFWERCEGGLLLRLLLLVYTFSLFFFSPLYSCFFIYFLFILFFASLLSVVCETAARMKRARKKTGWMDG
ncbi:hypothetical protein B0T22DRAFT_459458 [Podospora appendiculata]|uniref:Uncharacterized protein n=1 Tax=Podospora appendiculata TaxID=314037 RepID=A0AAE0X9F3_9PEZI|nr:hypothetical protein B0T22DRAFT_459458 [Podospora appendiculata]